MISLRARFRAALEVFRQGYPDRNSIVRKSNDFSALWPDYGEGQPEWHITDSKTYLGEGYSLNSLVYSSVMYKVRATATVPLRAYRGSRESPELVELTHEVVKRISKPNLNESWVDFHARNMIFFNVTGNVYIYEDPDTRFLYSLRPDKVFIVPEPEKSPPEPSRGLLGYLYTGNTLGAMSGFPILPEQLHHIRLPGPTSDLEGFGYGLPHLASAARSVDIDNTVTNFLKLFFNSGAMITGLLSFDVPLKSEVADDIISRWAEKFGGFEKWKVAVLDRGGTYQRVALTFEEMGFGDIDARNESRILGPFGVPPILIGAKLGIDKGTYSNYEAARAAVWEDTLVPEGTWFEQCYEQIFNVDDIFVMFDYKKVPAMQRSVIRQVDAAYTLVQMGVPRNKALRDVGLEYGDTPGGDESSIPTGRGVQQGSKVNAETESWGR